jgi:hypothetical protein
MLRYLPIVLAGCVGTPLPDPPDFGPLEGEPNGVRGGGFDVVGSVDIHDRSGLVVWGVNLEDTSPPITSAVAPDGSFRLFDIGSLENVVRLELRAGEWRSPPEDARIAWGALEAVEPALPCVEVATVLDLGRATSVGVVLDGSVRVINRCGSTIEIDARLRTAAGPFQILSAPSMVEDGGSIDVVVRFSAPATAGLYDQILFLDVGDAIDRRAVTLVARGPDS